MIQFKKKLLLFSSFLFIISILLSYTGNKFNSDNPSDKVKNYYSSKLGKFSWSISELKKASEELSSSKKSKENLKDAFFKCRAEYKSIEFLVTYFDTYSASILNSPALPKVTYGPTTIKEPTGFQVLEELIFCEEISENKKAIINELESMSYGLKEMERLYPTIEFSDPLVFDAIRNHLIRISSLGISGFDSPIAKKSISELIYSLESLRINLGYYYPLLSKDKSKIGIQTEELLKAAIKFSSKNSDFNNFDRLTFFKEYINPLYKNILIIQQSLLITFIDSRYAYNSAVNSQAKNIFDENLLKPYFFTEGKLISHNYEIAQLGKILFFDPVLSGNNKRSCASCHLPEKAFTDGKDKSVSFDFKGNTMRNSPSLLNSTFQNLFLWDGKVSFPEDQFHHVIFNPGEMNTTNKELILKLNSSEEYGNLFRKLFKQKQQEKISMSEIRTALGMYVRSLVALDSPFDQYMRGEISSIDISVKNGFNLFMGKAGCGTCHFAPIFNGTVPPFYEDTETEVLGIPSTNDTLNFTLDSDEGRFIVGAVEVHKHSFKTPSVRNIDLTAPYMHNGVFKTLEEVIDFYNKGGGVGIGLEVPNQTLIPDKLNLTSKEKMELISFMKALTDTSGTTSKPTILPKFNNTDLDKRIVGGEY